MKILVVDNYDSFTYNLVHLLHEMGHAHTTEVRRNDKIRLSEIAAFDKILLSPGPGIPSEAGIMPDLIANYAASKSILGICLGHQAIGEAFGGKLQNLPNVLHGVAGEANLLVRNEYLFNRIPESFKVAHYHSWVVSPENLPEDLEPIASNTDGLLMAIRHRRLDVRGLQFHPESVLTEHGATIIQNWLNH